MSEVATPAGTPATEPHVENQPTIPAATPTSTPEQVTLSKAEHDQLQRDAARAASNQRKADLYDRTVGKKGGSHFGAPQTSAPAPQAEDREEMARAEDRKAERGLIALAADPAFREALDADPTLRDLMVNNPLAVLPLMAPDALDAEDAIGLVKEKLSAKVASVKAKTTPATPPTTQTPPTTPPTGGVNPPTATTPDAEYEAARKVTNTESAITGMIKVGLKRTGGK